MRGRITALGWVLAFGVAGAQQSGPPQPSEPEQTRPAEQVAAPQAQPSLAPEVREPDASAFEQEQQVPAPAPEEEEEVVDAQAQQQKELEALRERVIRLEERLEQQSEALGTARQQLGTLGSEVQAQDETNEAEALEAVAEQELEAQRALFQSLQRATRDLSAAQELVESGNRDIGEWLVAARAQLEDASQTATEWGAPAQAASILSALDLIDEVDDLLANRNYFRAQWLLNAAEAHARDALALAQSDVIAEE